MTNELKSEHETSFLNEPKVACRNTRLLFLFPTCLSILLYCIVFYFRAPRAPKTSEKWSRPHTLLPVYAENSSYATAAFLQLTRIIRTLLSFSL